VPGPLAYLLSEQYENLEALLVAAFVIGMGWLAAYLWRRGRRGWALVSLQCPVSLATAGSGHLGVGLAALFFASLTACIAGWWMGLD